MKPRPPSPLPCKKYFFFFFFLTSCCFTGDSWGGHHVARHVAVGLRARARVEASGHAPSEGRPAQPRARGGGAGPERACVGGWGGQGRIGANRGGGRQLPPAWLGRLGPLLPGPGAEPTMRWAGPGRRILRGAVLRAQASPSRDCAAGRRGQTELKSEPAPQCGPLQDSADALARRRPPRGHWGSARDGPPVVALEPCVRADRPNFIAGRQALDHRAERRAADSADTRAHPRAPGVDSGGRGGPARLSVNPA